MSSPCPCFSGLKSTLVLLKHEEATKVEKELGVCVFSRGAGKGRKPERNGERTVKDGVTGHGFYVSEPGFLQEWSLQDFPLHRSQGGYWWHGWAWSVTAIHTNQMHPPYSALIVVLLTLSGFCFFKTLVSGPCK